MEIMLNFKAVRRRSSSPFGININYLRDADANRPQARPLREAVKAAGMGHLRYPGGGKSDRVLHMTPPFEKCVPQPRTKRYMDYAAQAEMMDFDEFMDVCRYAGCEPHLVVGCDNEDRSETTMEEFLQNAVHWVRYANKKGYSVKYWEIGNENWNDKNIPPEAFSKVAARFSKAMKAEDPSVLIGASGDKAEWWEKFLPGAAEYIDFLSVSQYSCWEYMRYDTYAYGADAGLLGVAKTALDSLSRYAPGHADRLFVVITEFNSRDYALEFGGAGWPSENNLGHALVNIDICGQIARESKIAYGMLWNTRWMNQCDQHNDIFYGLDAGNGLMPSTMCLYLWGRFMRNEILDVESPEGLAGYASRDENGLCLFLINKRGYQREITLSAPNQITGQAAQTYVYGGTDPSDLYPDFRRKADYRLGDEYILPPYSLTVFEWVK